MIVFRPIAPCRRRGSFFLKFPSALPYDTFHEARMTTSFFEPF